MICASFNPINLIPISQYEINGAKRNLLPLKEVSKFLTTIVKTDRFHYFHKSGNIFNLILF